MPHSSRRALYVVSACALIALLWLGSRAGTVLAVSAPLANPDAIVMLASHEWERLPAAARLAGAHPEAIVLLTEPREVTVYNCHLCGDRTNWLTHLGVAPGRIVVLPQKARNTYEEALAVRAYASEHPVKQLMVVTSVYHARRALTVFRAILQDTGITVGVMPTFDDPPAQPPSWWWLPYDRSYVAYEWTALAWYIVRHRVSPFV